MAGRCRAVVRDRDPFCSCASGAERHRSIRAVVLDGVPESLSNSSRTRSESASMTAAVSTVSVPSSFRTCSGDGCADSADPCGFSDDAPLPSGVRVSREPRIRSVPQRPPVAPPEQPHPRCH
ncbi:hypothetical protein C9J85_07055 [Haloferax sp. wsp5]|nr:hypothetical protein C9J85_07055 [Haloferax sp. wsp5]